MIFEKIGYKLLDLIKVIPNGKLVLCPNYRYLEKLYGICKQMFSPIPCFREY